MLAWSWSNERKLHVSILVGVDHLVKQRSAGDNMIGRRDLPSCPVATTVSLIGNKWKPLILRDVRAGPKRFGELQKSLDGISQKILTDNLRELENDGLLVRTVFPEVPPRVEYSLSELGKTLEPLLDAMAQWGFTYISIVKDILSK